MSLTLTQTLDARTRAGFQAPPFSVAYLAGCLVAAALLWPLTAAFWTTGTWHDPDDAMRMVEVRDFLAGQGWYDLVAHRLFPPTGTPMHWSRLIDLPLAGGILALSPLVGVAQAERVVSVAVPTAYFLVALALALDLGRRLAGRVALVPTAILFAASIETLGQFLPGHIDHHGAQVTLLLATVDLVVAGLSSRALPMAGAGLTLALSLAISLENMPFFAVLGATLGLVHAGRGAALARPLAAFGASLAASCLLAYVVDVPPARWGERVCDAYSLAHLLGFGLSGAGFAVLARLPPAGPRARLAGLVALGAAVVATLAVVSPACLGDPLRGLDPLLRREWLADVAEAMPLDKLVARDPLDYLPLLAVLALGCASALAACVAARGLARERWAVVAAMALVGFAGAFWQVRMAASGETFAVLGGVWAVTFAVGTGRVPRPFAVLVPFAVGLPFAQAAWGLVMPSPLATPGAVAGPSCVAPTTLRALDTLAPGLILSTLDPGSHILAHTRHAVVAGAYHRDVRGDRLAILAFKAPPAEAEPFVRASGADLVVLCPTSAEARGYASTDPAGLAARLSRGDAPDWLAQVEMPGTPLLVYRVKSLP